MLRKTMLVLAFASAALALVLLAMVGGKWSVSARSSGEARPTAAFATQAAPALIVGELAGTTADGTPVYRLPPINVATTRSAELARNEREEQQAAAGAVRLPPTVARAPQGDVRAAAPGAVVR